MVEASATTVNITGTSPIQVEETAGVQHEVKHTHGPNFGRYVAKCPACIAKYPNGPEKRTRKAKPVEDKDAEIERLKAELAKSYTQSVKPVQSDSDVNRELANLMLKREAKQLRQEEELESRKAEARADFLRVAKEQEAQKLARETNCSHTKENRRSAVADQQIHNNGMVRPFCMRCGKVWPWRRPTMDQMPTAVSYVS